MQKYKKTYFMLFCAVCNTIELIEEILSNYEIETETAKLLTAETERLKTAQQQAEEIIISD